jgi:flagellar biosynthesis/type III secretory pathway protein FliH
MISEEIKQKMMKEVDTRYPDGGVDAARSTFFHGCEHGYSLASSEIEALKKEVERIKQIFETQCKADAKYFFSNHLKYSTESQIDNMVNDMWSEVIKNKKL